MKYELELNNEISSVNRIKQLLDHLYDILTIQNEDSEKGIDSGAGVHYKIKIDVQEKWI